MQYIYDWVTQIIVFIFIGTIIQMMLPSNQFKKYVEIVLGLFLLLLLLQPVSSLMNISLDLSWEKIESHVFPENMKEKIQMNGLDSKRDAYIWKETKTVLMEEANEQVKDVEIYDMDLQVDGDELEGITVYIEEKAQAEKVVESIVIGEKGAREWEEDDEDTLLRQQLTQIWDVDQVPIKVKRGRRLR